MDYEKLSELMKEHIDSSTIPSEAIPEIQLYMDQITTLVNERLPVGSRPDTDKALTKTMINNYTKTGLISPPVKKKYNKESILSLIMIYSLKSILSINDIKTLLNSFDSQKTEEIYDFFTSFQAMAAEKLNYEIAANTDNIKKYNPDKKTFFLLNAMMLTCFAAAEKQLAEKLIDSWLIENNTSEVKREHE